jgi:hypothetical protein
MEVFMKINVEVFNEKIVKHIVLSSLLFPIFGNEVPQLSATVKPVNNPKEERWYDKEATSKLRNLLFAKSVPVDACEKLV